MEDASRQNRALVREILMPMTVEERFSICAERYEDANRFTKIALPEGLSLASQEKAVF